MSSILEHQHPRGRSCDAADDPVVALVRSGGAVRHRALLVICAVLLLCANAAVAEENFLPHVSQLAHSSWRITDGALPSSPNAIAQTKDGYLWIGTDVGLFRFDGVRFVQWPVPASIRMERVLSLLADRDGSLWIGARSTLLHLSDGEITQSKRVALISHMMQLPNGEIWTAAGRMAKEGVGAPPLCQAIDNTLVCVDGLPSINGVTLATDGKDGIWIVLGSGELCHRDQASVQCMMPDKLNPAWTGKVQRLTTSAQGELWAGLDREGAAPLLIHLSNGRWDEMPALPGIDVATSFQSMKFDANGALWIGTSNRGLYRLIGSHVDRFDTTDGLSANDVTDIEIDTEHSVWVTTAEGLDQFHVRPIESWSTREGLSADSVSGLDVDSEGRVWMGNNGALDVLDGGQVRSYNSNKLFGAPFIEAVLADYQGQVWFGANNSLWRFDQHSFAKVTGPTDGNQTPVLAEDVRHAIWGRLDDGLFRLKDGKFDVIAAKGYGAGSDFAIDPLDGIWMVKKGKAPAHAFGGILDLLGSPPVPNDTMFPAIIAFDGYVWTFTSAGIVAWKDGVSRTIATMNEIDVKIVYSAVRDRDGNLWLMTVRDYVEIAKNDIEQRLKDPAAIVHAHHYGTEAGARPGFPTFTHSSVLAPNGDLWFATDKFPQRIRPRQMSIASATPPVIVEALIADGKSYQVADGVTLPKGAHTIEIDYTGLSFINSARMTFRYQLDGVDDLWQEAGARRQALYTDLPPGTHAFHVMASNSEGVWSPVITSLSFITPPTFFQSLWFRLLLALAVVAAFLIFSWLRKEQVTRAVRVRLYERLAERERIARDLHDTFFQGIQGLLLRFQTGVSSLRKDDPARPIFESALEQSDGVMLEGREMVLDLRERMVNEKELGDVLRAVGEDLELQHAAKFTLSIVGRPKTLQPTTREELFRIGKEALLNAFRHAEADHIAVDLDYAANRLLLRISDDGKGIDDAVTCQGRRAGHWGLPGMRERAEIIGASFAVRSESHVGTILEISVPAACAFARSKRISHWFGRLRGQPN